MPTRSNICDKIFRHIEDPAWFSVLNYVYEDARRTVTRHIRNRIEDILEDAIELPVRRAVRDVRPWS